MQFSYLCNHRLATFIAIHLLCVHMQVGFAQSDPKDYSPESLQRQFLREAEGYEIEVTSDKRKLVLQTKPLLNWQNPERQSTLGSLFVWFDGSRPAVIASVFTFQVNQQLLRKHEVISLFPESLNASLDGEQVWTPGPSDLKGIEVSSNISPAGTEAGRLSQMRTIAREFVGKHHPRENSPPQELRLLSQPMLRYKSEPDKIIDGALFALAVGTDPEILLMIEARQVDQGVAWKVVPFRSHFDKLELTYKGKMVWSVPLVSELMSTGPMELPFAKEPFYVFYPSQELPSAETLKQLNDRPK